MSCVPNPSMNPLIKFLPPEILVPIFQLVISSQECICRFPTRRHVLLYPDTLVQVCSHWRQVGINSPILWTHIDLLTNRWIPRGEKAIGRAETNAERAGELPLDVHLPTFPNQTGPIIDDLSQLLSRSSIAARARSLRVSFELEPYRNDLLFRPLSRLFGGCKPGTLTALTMWSNSLRIGHPSESSPLPLGLSKEDLESILLHINSLSLHMIYFPWSSTAYHGLVELRLTGCQDHVTIPESQLANMLRASPGLRIFEFGLHIERDLSSNTPITPIRLAELEALNLTSVYLLVDLGLVLWRLVPGSKALQLTLPGCQSEAGELIYCTQPFFARSNISTLYTTGFSLYSAAALASRSPKLRTLVIDKLEHDVTLTSYKTQRARRLEVLYIVNSGFELDELVAFLTLCPTQKLILWGARVSHSKINSKDITMQKLSEVCGDIQWLSSSVPNPTESLPLLVH